MADEQKHDDPDGNTRILYFLSIIRAIPEGGLLPKQNNFPSGSCVMHVYTFKASGISKALIHSVSHSVL